MGDWRLVRFGEVASIKHGWPFKSKLCSLEQTGRPIVVNTGNYRYDGGFRFDETVTREYIGEFPSEYITEPGDILLIMTCQTPGGEILGVPGRIPNDGRIYLHNQRLGKVVIKSKKELDSGYIYWVCLWNVFNQHLVATATGTKILHTAPSRIEGFRFWLPSFFEQRAIAQLLNALQGKIELNRQTNETLEALARAIFKDWFVDFGPTRAKVEGQESYLATELWELFPDALDDEDKPVGWEISEIGKEVKALGGGTPSTKQPTFWDAGEHNWATPKDLSKLSSPVLLRTDRQISDAGIENISSGLLPVGTVLLSSRAPIGYLAIAEAPTAVNQGFIAMVCDKRLTNLFVFFWCEQHLDYIKGIAGGTTFAEISKKVFRPIPVVVPSSKSIQAFDEIVRPLYNKIVSNTKENEMLAQTRDLLLPKLMSGEIRLKDVEHIVGEVV
jgi:type I restriction enzyme S subunit